MSRPYFLGLPRGFAILDATNEPDAVKEAEEIISRECVNLERRMSLTLYKTVHVFEVGEDKKPELPDLKDFNPFGD